MLSHVCGEGDQQRAPQAATRRTRATQLAHGNLGRRLRGIAINAATDGGKGDIGQAMRLGQRQTVAVAGRQPLRLSTLAAVPDRADRVDPVSYTNLTLPTSDLK